MLRSFFFECLNLRREALHPLRIAEILRRQWWRAMGGWCMDRNRIFKLVIAARDRCRRVCWVFSSTWPAQCLGRGCFEPRVRRTSVDHAGTRHANAAPDSALRSPRLAFGRARLVPDCGCARQLRGHATRRGAHRLFYRPSTYCQSEGRSCIRQGASTEASCETARRNWCICKARTLARQGRRHARVLYVPSVSQPLGISLPAKLNALTDCYRPLCVGFVE